MAKEFVKRYLFDPIPGHDSIDQQVAAGWLLQPSLPSKGRYLAHSGHASPGRVPDREHRNRE